MSELVGQEQRWIIVFSSVYEYAMIFGNKNRSKGTKKSFISNDI